MSLFEVLVTGLIAGGLSCAVVQAGLLVGAITRTAGMVDGTVPAPRRWAGDLVAVAGFLAGKLMSHVVLGALLGAIGAQLEFSPRTRGYLQIGAGALMVLFALDIVGVRWVRLLFPAPPASWTRAVRRSGRLSSAAGPALMGVTTILVPCGITLGMEFLAIASGSSAKGAAIMGAFVLGTVPIFAAIGLATGRAVHRDRSRPSRLRWVVGGALTFSAVLSVNAGLVLAGSSWAPLQAFRGTTSEADVSAESAPAAAVVIGADGIQRAVVLATDDGYSPDVLRLKAGVPTKITFTATGFSCTNVVIISSLGIEAFMEEGQSKEVDLGSLSPGLKLWSCGMGMYIGKLVVKE